jgi:Tfp pilus assembly PilM family ATPase
LIFRNKKNQHGIGIEVSESEIIISKVAKHAHEYELVDYRIIKSEGKKGRFTKDGKILVSVASPILTSAIKSMKSQGDIAVMSIRDSDVTSKIFTTLPQASDREIYNMINSSGSKYISTGITSQNFDFYETGRLGSTGQKEIMLKICAKEIVNDIEELLLSSGLLPASIDVDSHVYPRIFPLLSRNHVLKGEVSSTSLMVKVNNRKMEILYIKSGEAFLSEEESVEASDIDTIASILSKKITIQAMNDEPILQVFFMGDFKNIFSIKKLMEENVKIIGGCKFNIATPFKSIKRNRIKMSDIDFTLLSSSLTLSTALAITGVTDNA